MNDPNSNSILLFCSDAHALTEARRICETFGFALRCDGSGAQSPTPGLLLRYDEETGLSLCNPEQPTERMRVDFIGGRTGFRLGTHANTSQPLLKALGFREPPFCVLDGTAGLGGDGMLLACAGCRVILCERAPVMAALLIDGLRRAQEEPELAAIIRERVELLHLDTAEALLRRAGEYDAVYLDPMFPQRQKTALVKKEMRLAKLAAGEDPDAAQILQLARAHARRVVVKRPLKAEALAAGFSRQIKGRSIRFDIYISS